MLGRADLTSKELSMILLCEGATFINNVLTTVGSEGCPFCVHGRESRFHWRHECTQSQLGFLQLYQAVSKELATTRPLLWFYPERRVDVASGTVPRSSKWWKASGIRTIVPEGDGMTWDFETLGQKKG